MQHLQKLSFRNYLALDLYVLLATYSSPTTFHGEKTFSNLELGMKQYTLLCAKSSTTGAVSSLKACLRVQSADASTCFEFRSLKPFINRSQYRLLTFNCRPIDYYRYR